MTPQELIKVLSVLTLSSNVGATLFLVSLVLLKLNVAKKQNQKILTYFSKKSLFFSFVVALTATVGSLYFSEVAHFEPCKLCWFQRIFMYPLPLMLGISLWKKTKDVDKYVLPLSIIGLLVAAYHYYFQVTGNPLIPCSTVGFSVSCSERFFTYFGYITIPWMSLSAFLLIVIAMLVVRKVRRRIS